jgi:beta-galactosidase/beta-glucuronidase
MVAPSSSDGRGVCPRPLLVRERWASLDGEWEFALDRQADWREPGDVRWDGRIRVPFSPETALSGVAAVGFFSACWYRLRAPPFITTDELSRGHRLLLHFGAVDHHADVWANARWCGEHDGGYTPFSFDITPRAADGPVEIVVRAHDDPLDLAKPRGKQDWQLAPHSIWYPRTTGIWQTVWLEVVPPARIQQARWTSSLDHWEIAAEIALGGAVPDGARVSVRLGVGDRALARDSYEALSHEVNRRIAFPDPGVDDSRNELLWSPHSPTLLEATVELHDGAGRLLDRVSSYTALRAIAVQGDRILLNGRPYPVRMVLDQGYWPQSGLTAPDEGALRRDVELEDGAGQLLDRISSYTALRSIAVQGDRILLNGRPYPVRMVLDQGYWPEAGMTAPDEGALRRDVELAKAMGFNGVRKHQKIEDPRYLYWADRLGLLVWEEMPSAYRFTTRTVARLTREWMDVLARDASHPCIMAWVPFNESWGVPNLPDKPAERDWVRGLYHLTKTLDPTRPVIGNDGWESVATDIIGIHDYDDLPEEIAARYASHEHRPQLFRHARPGGRLLVLAAGAQLDHPVVLSEFGGIACSADLEGTWGYRRCANGAELLAHYGQLLEVVRSRDMLAGFCYTQFADTYQEANGLLYADRTPKAPLEQIATATRGTRSRR